MTLERAARYEALDDKTPSEACGITIEGKKHARAIAYALILRILAVPQAFNAPSAYFFARRSYVHHRLRLKSCDISLGM